MSRNLYKYKYSVKKPVRSFRDLEVYQKTMEASVVIVKNLKGKLARLKYPFLENMTNCSMSIPLYIGEAHSMRFGDHKTAILLLEKAMAGCNKMIIYLEQIIGIYRPSPEVAFHVKPYSEAVPARYLVPQSGEKGEIGTKVPAFQRRVNVGSGTPSAEVDTRALSHPDGTLSQGHQKDRGAGAIDHDLLEDLIRRYADVRQKIFRLEKSWERISIK